MTQSYRVEWAIDMIADTPEEAAAMALIVQRDNDPANLATVFQCFNEVGEVTQIDLTALAEEKPGEPEPVKDYKIQIGQDARVYHTAVSTGTVSEIQSNLSRHGYSGQVRKPGWIGDGSDAFDNTETFAITDPDTDTVVAFYTDGDGWAEPDEIKDLI